ncbi:MAG: hypothetical protein ACJ712_01660 [Nitrososphaeraceae archaeon]
MIYCGSDWPRYKQICQDTSNKFNLPISIEIVPPAIEIVSQLNWRKFFQVFNAISLEGTKDVDTRDFINELVRTQMFSEEGAIRYIKMAQQSGDIEMYEQPTSCVNKDIEALRFLGFPPVNQLKH